MTSRIYLLQHNGTIQPLDQQDKPSSDEWGGGTVSSEPALTQLAGRRAAVITWQADVEGDGVTSTVDKRAARILNDEWDAWIIAAGPVTARQLLRVEFDRPAASLVLRSPTVRLRQ